MLSTSSPEVITSQNFILFFDDLKAALALIRAAELFTNLIVKFPALISFDQMC